MEGFPIETAPASLGTQAGVCERLSQAFLVVAANKKGRMMRASAGLEDCPGVGMVRISAFFHFKIGHAVGPIGPPVPIALHAMGAQVVGIDQFDKKSAAGFEGAIDSTENFPVIGEAHEISKTCPEIDDSVKLFGKRECAHVALDKAQIFAVSRAAAGFFEVGGGDV